MDLDERILSLQKQHYTKTKKLTRPKNGQLEMKFYDWIELLLENEKIKKSNDHRDEGNRDNDPENKNLGQTEIIIISNKLLTIISSHSEQSDEDYLVIKIEIMKLLILFITGGHNIPDLFHILSSLLPSMRKIRSLLYLGLILVEESSSSIPCYKGDTLTTIIDHLSENDYHSYYWLCSTNCSFTSLILENFLEHILRHFTPSVSSGSALFTLASTAIVNLYRKHEPLYRVKFAKITQRCIDIMDRRVDEDASVSSETSSKADNPPLISFRVLKNIINYLTLYFQTCDSSEEYLVNLVANKLSDLLHETLENWPEWRHHGERTKSVHIICSCLRYFQVYSNFWCGRPSLVSSTWYSNTLSSFRTILNKVLSYESEDDKAIDPDLPLGRYRSAGLVASLQNETLTFLFNVYSLQLNNCTTSIGSKIPNCQEIRSNSSSSQLTSLSEESQHYLSEKNTQNTIYGFTILLTSLKCLTRLIEHKDRHIQLSALKHLPILIKLSVHSTKMLSSNISNSNGNEITDWVHFHAFLQKSLEDVVIPVLLELLHDKEKTLYIDSLRIVIDSLICLGSNEVIRKVQNILTKLLHSDEIEISQSDADREYARGLMLCAQRCYIQNLQAVATIAKAPFLDISTECDGRLHDVLSLSIKQSCGSVIPCQPLTSEDCLIHWSNQTLLGTPPTPLSEVFTIQNQVSMLSNRQNLDKVLSEFNCDRSETASVYSGFEGTEVIQSSFAPSPRKKGILSALGFGHLRSKKRVSIGGEDIFRPPELNSTMSILKFSNENVLLVLTEELSIELNDRGIMESYSIYGHLLYSSTLNHALDMEIGLNLNNPDVFPLIGQRLSEAESVVAHHVDIDMTYVKKIDSRGSVLASIPTGEKKLCPLLGYSLNPLLLKGFPILITCTANYRHDKTLKIVFIDIQLSYQNTSTTMKVTGFESIISLQTIQSILKLSHHSTLGNECLVTGWDQDKDDSPILRISFPKLKANSQLSVSITVEGRIYENQPWKKLPNSTVQSTFSLHESKTSHQIKNSTYSHVGIRYINIASSNGESSSMSSTKFPVKLKISYKVVSFKSPINEYHEGFLNEKHDKESISTHHHHYHSNEIEMYWSEHEDDKSTSDSESDGDEERTIVVHRSALNSGGESISSKISTSNVPKNGSTKKEIATPISTQESASREVPHSQVSTVVVDVPNELSPEIIKSNPHEDNDHPEHKTQVPDVSSSTFPDDTSKSTDRPILHIQLSNVSLEDEPIVIQKQRPPSLPPPSSMKPVQQKKPKPPVAPPPGDKSKSLKKESRSEKSSSPSLPSETKKKHSSSNSVGKKTQNSKKMVSLTINLDEPEEGEI